MTFETPEHLIRRFKVLDAPEVDFFLPKNKNGPLGKSTLEQDNDEIKAKLPKLFTPLKIHKNLEINNRIGVSPMCTYSADNKGSKKGEATKFHEIHYGGFSSRGPGLIIVEAASVVPNGRTSPEDLGIWNDDQALLLKPIVDFAHSQGVKIGIQIAHAGRKSSGVAIPEHLQKGISSALEGWSDKKGPDGVFAPSPVAYDENNSYVEPQEIPTSEIKDYVKAFGDAAKRAYDISGFDFVEIHGAHGYLISTFLSSTSNKRSDEYGGSFENRIRFLLEIIDEVKSENHPTFVRLSADELAPNDPESWKIEDSIKLSDHLVNHGVEVLDLSSGGINSKAERRKTNQGFQTQYAKAIKDHVGDKLLIATVGKILEAKFANDVLENDDADIILAGKPFLKNPGLVSSWADELGVRIQLARQYEWPFHPPPWNLD
ncbi:hypothetical protein WICMUC_000381 [Wickerhamomyces mucosus]|uniref:NADH:flavin oxidoreductase/NADH oxidase N-terminal domain-containing protein n=2 Tax=Wickerhamomyces TaxID=599737 RepID=A0A9P8TIR3_9ASCO|nr:hypothetical protein WICMUC_000381 [Wickerhamomyces mucosus]